MLFSLDRQLALLALMWTHDVDAQVNLLFKYNSHRAINLIVNYVLVPESAVLVPIIIIFFGNIGSHLRFL